MPKVERCQLTPEHSISRVIKGGWQLAGGHGVIDREQALEDMRLYTSAGITTFDCADIYTGVEELIGQFLRRHKSAMTDGSLPAVQVHTKLVPDLDDLPTLTRLQLEAIVDRSIRRLGVERLDLVQLHWWDYEIPGYVEAALHLDALRHAGKVKHLAVTNFDVPHLQKILDAGVAVAANQVQYSLLDRRPQSAMVPFCAKHGIRLLCYGTLAGGFLTDRYLGVPEPQPPYENRSLTKYRLIVEEFGGWDLFQRMLGSLGAIARKHGASIAAVAVRAVLQEEGVAAVIVGVRHARHLADTIRVFDLELDADDMAAIRNAVKLARGPLGDVYSVERIKGGRHAAVMKYNLGSS